MRGVFVHQPHLGICITAELQWHEHQQRGVRPMLRKTRRWSPPQQLRSLNPGLKRDSNYSSISPSVVASSAGVSTAATDSLTAALSAMNTPLWILGLRCLGSAAAAIAGALAIRRVLCMAADKQDAGEDLEGSTSASLDEDGVTEDGSVSMKSDFFRTALNSFWVALHRPVSLLIPIIAVAYSAKQVEKWLQAVVLWQVKHQTLSEFQCMAVRKFLHVVRKLDNLIGELDGLALIALGVWVLLRFKNRVVQRMVHRSLRTQAKHEANVLLDPSTKQDRATVATIERVLLPLSGFASWVIVAAGALTALHVVGISLQPLLAVGGVSGVIAGLSAQSVVSNMLTGVNLFLSQPFVVGERVKLMTHTGSTAFEGTIERIDPMRTVIRSDQDMPMIMQNKSLGDMVIVNESRVAYSRVRMAYNKPRALDLHFSLRYQDCGCAEAVMQAMRTKLMTYPLIDTSLPWTVRLLSYDNHSLNVNLHAHTTAAGARSMSSLRTRVLLDMNDVIKQHGASLAYPVNTAPLKVLNEYAGSRSSSGKHSPGNEHLNVHKHA